MYASTWIKDIEKVKKIIIESREVADNISLIDSYGAITPLEMRDFFIKMKKLKQILMVFIFITIVILH